MLLLLLSTTRFMNHDRDPRQPSGVHGASDVSVLDRPSSNYTIINVIEVGERFDLAIFGEVVVVWAVGFLQMGASTLHYTITPPPVPFRRRVFGVYDIGFLAVHMTVAVRSVTSWPI